MWAYNITHFALFKQEMNRKSIYDHNKPWSMKQKSSFNKQGDMVISLPAQNSKRNHKIQTDQYRWEREREQSPTMCMREKK